MKDFARIGATVRIFSQRLLTPGNTLSQRVVHAGFWAFSLRIVDRLFGLIRSIILARLLVPEDFGLFGIALLAISVLDAFSQTGFQAALIQKKSDVKPYLDTAWTVQVMRGFVLATILDATAPIVATFFNEPCAAMLLRVLALSKVAEGFANIGVIFFQKELSFQKQFLYMFSGTLADFSAATIAAVLMRNAWALVFGFLTGNIVRAVVSYILHEHRPNIMLNKELAREMYRFGRWIMATNIMVFLATNGDNAIVGKVLGAGALGLYQMAFQFSNLMRTEITAVLSQVAFPAFVLLQDNVVSLKKAFLKTLQATFGLSFPLTIGIIMLGSEFVRLFLGDAWVLMSPTLQILAISGLIRSVVATGGPLFKGTGRPQLDFWMNVVRVGVMAVLIYPLTSHYGTEGTAISVVLGIAATLPIWWIASKSIAQVDWQTFLGCFFPSAVAAVVMSATIAFFKTILDTATLAGFILVSAVAVSVYASIYFALLRKNRFGPFRLLGYNDQGGRELHSK